MKKEVIFVLLDKFSDWECAYLSSALNVGIEFQPKETEYIAKTMSISGQPVRSMGGFLVSPDYSLDTLPHDYCALVLVGGLSWFDQEAKLLLSLIERSISNNIIVAAICNASLFLAINGFLNSHKHTSNTLEFILQLNEGKYTGKQLYQEQQAVRDNNIITANGSATLEFTQEVLLALSVDNIQNIQQYYQINKNGFYSN